MNRFLAFLQKEFHHIFRDPRTLVILFGIPIAQLLLFGFVLTNEVRNVKIGVVDHSKDYLSIRMTQRLYYLPDFFSWQPPHHRKANTRAYSEAARLRKLSFLSLILGVGS